jgi:hypothetical protein
VFVGMWVSTSVPDDEGDTKSIELLPCSATTDVCVL